MDQIQARFDLARDLALDSAQIILPKFQRQFQIEVKDNGSYVTEIDKAVEKELTEMIKEHFPQDKIIGEEFGISEGSNSYTWTLDPIDGTSSFVHGVPFFGTMIGLLENDSPIFGLVHFPALNESYYAIKGKGAYWKPSHLNEFIPCQSSACDSLSNALFSYSDKAYFQLYKEDDLLHKLQSMTKSERVWGDCYGHMLVATGRAQIMVDPYFYIWDLIPIKVIVEESGASMIDTSHPKNSQLFRGISCSKEVKDEVLSLLK